MENSPFLEYLQQQGMSKEEAVTTHYNMALERLAELEDTLKKIEEQVLNMPPELDRIILLEQMLLDGFMNISGDQAKKARALIKKRRNAL